MKRLDVERIGCLNQAWVDYWIKTGADLNGLEPSQLGSALGSREPVECTPFVASASQLLLNSLLFYSCGWTEGSLGG